VFPLRCVGSRKRLLTKNRQHSSPFGSFVGGASGAIVKNDCLGMDGCVVLRWRGLIFLSLFFVCLGLGEECDGEFAGQQRAWTGHVFWRGKIGVGKGGSYLM